MGTAERRQRERERKEREIVETARELFFEKGYLATTVDDIAARLEVSKGSIYLRFSSKDEIYYAVARSGLEVFRDMLASASADGTGLERFTAMGRAYVEFWTSYPEHRRLFGESGLVSPPSTSGPQGLEFIRVGDEATALMVRAVNDGIEDGSIRSGVSPELLVFCASSAVEGVLSGMERRGAKMARLGKDREEVLTFLFDLFRDALRTP